MVYRLLLLSLSLLVTTIGQTTDRTPASLYSYDQCRPTKQYMKFLNQRVKKGDVLVFRTDENNNKKVLLVHNTSKPVLVGHPLFLTQDLKQMKKTIDKLSVSIRKKSQDGSSIHLADKSTFIVLSVKAEKGPKDKIKKYSYEVASKSGQRYQVSCSNQGRQNHKDSAPCLYAHFQFDKRSSSSHQRFELRDKKRPSGSHKCRRFRQDDLEDATTETPVER